MPFVLLCLFVAQLATKLWKVSRFLDCPYSTPSKSSDFLHFLKGHICCDCEFPLFGTAVGKRFPRHSPLSGDDLQ